MRIFFIIIYLISAGISYAQMAEVPLDIQQNIPAQNLIYQGQSRTSDYAKGLLRNGIDLSELNPKANSMWGPEVTENQDKDQELKTESGEHVYFKSIVTTNDGLMRFDALRNNNSVGTY